MYTTIVKLVDEKNFFYIFTIKNLNNLPQQLVV